MKIRRLSTISLRIPLQNFGSRPALDKQIALFILIPMDFLFDLPPPLEYFFLLTSLYSGWVQMGGVAFWIVLDDEQKSHYQAQQSDTSPDVHVDHTSAILRAPQNAPPFYLLVSPVY